MRLIDAATVERYLSVEVALESMRRCFADEAAGLSGPAARVDLPHKAGWMRVLPAVASGLGLFGHKVISFRREVGVRYVVTLFDIATGDLRAVVDAKAITGARTGATAALAAELLAPPEVTVSALIGTGSVARTQLPALQAVRPVEEIRVYSRQPENRAGFIAEMEGTLDVRFVDCASIEEAIEGAGIVTLATKSADSLLFARHLRPGVHVNSVGSARPNLSEVDPAAFPEFDRVVCDSVELVFNESGDAIAAEAEGLFDREEAVDLSAIRGSAPARGAVDVTLFKSTGSGLQDIYLAAAILEAAEADGGGSVMEGLLGLKEFRRGGPNLRFGVTGAGLDEQVLAPKCRYGRFALNDESVLC